MSQLTNNDTRLIERWFPIAAIGEESERERRSMTALPPTYYLHVWWARRPLVASRAAILASLLPDRADHDQFLRLIGIHGDPVQARQEMDLARLRRVRIPNPYSHKRAFKYSLSTAELDLLANSLDSNQRHQLSTIKVLDPTAGGGSIPFEAIRLGLSAAANDLNPVASLVLKATIDWPRYGTQVIDCFNALAARWRCELEHRLAALYPDGAQEEQRDQTYLFARTVTCPYCAGLVPLSPNWRLTSNGTGVKIKPNLQKGPNSLNRTCSFEIVESTAAQSEGTVARGVATCPYDDCGRVIAGDEIKQQAQAGDMGEQLYAVVYRYPVTTETKSGRARTKMVKAYRAPRPEDDNSAVIAARLAEKLAVWEALDIVPTEQFPSDTNDSRPIQYGMPYWRDLFSPRQLLCHGTSVEVYRELLQEDENAGKLTEVRKAAYGYLAIAIDKTLDYNSRKCIWESQRESVAHTFSRHDYSFAWSYAEMALLVKDAGYDWAIRQTSKCISELSDLLHPESAITDKLNEESNARIPVQVSCKPGDRLDHIDDQSVDLIVIDPPYYDNVMYAELSDFFYVWLKRTAGYVFPELFKRALTDKDNEAIANPVRFKGERGVKQLAARDYQERMAAIFEECRRALKSNGVMTLMFNHKATGAWDALTAGLIQAGFAITASWPVSTEAPGSMHIKDKAAAKSTILLVCRPRKQSMSRIDDQPRYWEDIEPLVEEAVKGRIEEFQKACIHGVDLFLSAFGPALEKFSENWPLIRGTPRSRHDAKQLKLINALGEDAWDPYAVTPEDALDAARREVKRWRLSQIAATNTDTELDPVTAFFVFAWDTFKAPTFPYDEALQLARCVGVDLDTQVVNRLAVKKASNLTLLDSVSRANRSFLGPSSGQHGMIDAIHHAAMQGRDRTLDRAREQLKESNELQDKPEFQAALGSVLEVLPPSKRFTRFDLKGDLATASTDFETLFDLSQVLYGVDMNMPKQLDLWQKPIDEN